MYPFYAEDFVTILGKLYDVKAIRPEQFVLLLWILKTDVSPVLLV